MNDNAMFGSEAQRVGEQLRQLMQDEADISAARDSLHLWAAGIDHMHPAEWAATVAVLIEIAERRMPR